MNAWNNESVVVTGAGGFVGSHLCEALVAKGAQVTALDNFAIGCDSNLSSVSHNVQIAKCDITKKGDVAKWLKDSHIVFHLAAIANPRTCRANFDLAFKVGVIGTKNVLDACKNCERVVFMSSAAVYGDPSYIPIDERHQLNGKDPYAITKIVGEYLCKNYCANYGIPVVIARNFNAFGPRQFTDYIVPTLICQGLRSDRIEIWNPRPTRDLMYIDNTIEALIRIAETEEFIGEVVNIGSGDETVIGALAQRVSSIMGVPLVDLGKEVTGSMRLVCDNRKLKEVSGWRPRVSLEEGLRMTIEWYRRNIER